MSYIQSLPAISHKTSNLLILGSMPGKISLARNQYYAHPRNNFWPFIEEIFAISRGLPYADRCNALADCGVAVWDVLKACLRSSSLDSDIITSSIVPNDFAGFFAEHPNIQQICFNGTKAAHVYVKHVVPLLPAESAAIPIRRLPSTSPANASIPLNRKLEAWRIISSKV